MDTDSSEETAGKDQEGDALRAGAACVYGYWQWMSVGKETG